MILVNAGIKQTDPNAFAVSLPNSADVLCCEDSVLLSLEYVRFREFLDLFPGTTYALLDQTVQRLLAAQSSA